MKVSCGAQRQSVVWNARGSKAHQNHGSGLEPEMYIRPRQAALLNILHQSTFCNVANNNNNNNNNRLERPSGAFVLYVSLLDFIVFLWLCVLILFPVWHVSLR